MLCGTHAPHARTFLLVVGDEHLPPAGGCAHCLTYQAQKESRLTVRWPIASMPPLSGARHRDLSRLLRPLPVTPWSNTRVLFTITDRFNRRSDMFTVAFTADSNCQCPHQPLHSPSEKPAQCPLGQRPLEHLCSKLPHVDGKILLGASKIRHYRQLLWLMLC